MLIPTLTNIVWWLLSLSLQTHILINSFHHLCNKSHSYWSEMPVHELKFDFSNDW